MLSKAGPAGVQSGVVIRSSVQESKQVRTAGTGGFKAAEEGRR